MLAIMPGTDIRHQISAAMAEIVVNMAIARWPGPYELRPIATRDQRLLLAAAMFRLLRHEQPRTLAADPDIEGQLFLQASRIGSAKEELTRLLSTYINLVGEQSRIIPGPSTSQQPPEPGGEDPVAAELANRVLLVLEALAQSVVVVPVDRESTPAVLTVRVPPREMTERGGWVLAKPSTWILRPLGHLQIDLLLPSADADRQVQMNLPEGLFFEEEGSARASLDIEVALPRALKHLAVLMTQLLDTQSRALQQCIADLAKAKADIARETLRQHHVGSVVAPETQAGISGQTATDNAGAQLDQLCAGLDQISLGLREEPVRDWAAPAHVHDLDPDWLAPLEHITSTLDVFVGVPLDCGLLTLLRHPRNDVLGTASRPGLLVLEIQLPVPAAVAVEVGCAWARVRIAVRDVDIRHIGPFLGAIDRLTSKADGKRRPLSLAVRAGPTGGPRIISRSAASAGASRLILASDLDVIALAANDRVSVKDACWQVLTICADARSGIENDILGRLSEQRPGLHVAGLTYALLHGTAAAMLLGHEPGRRTGGDRDLQHDLGSGRALTKLQVVVNEWRSREQLGYVERRPLLRVHFRAQDRPGTLLDVLDALSMALQEELPSFSARKLHTWYAHTQVIGGADPASLTVRLDTEAEKVESWNASTCHDTERKIWNLAAHQMEMLQTASNIFSEKWDAIGGPGDQPQPDHAACPAETQHVMDLPLR